MARLPVGTEHENISRRERQEQKDEKVRFAPWRLPLHLCEKQQGIIINT